MTDNSALEQAEHEFEPGYVLHDRYEVRHPLGAGGFATVYEAYDTTIERPIALKVLNIEKLSRGSEPVELIRERFLREARLAAKIRHPSIIEIYDFGVLEESNQPFMMMEYLEGTDLDREIKDRGCLSVERFLPLFVEALQGLGEAHEQGVIHKDLKPANLFLTRPGTTRERLKVVDFGIAHVHEGADERLTKTGSFTGTPYYLPQEYLQEQDVSPAMDVYQMGLILVEAITGDRVIVADTAYQAAIKHISREFRIPSGLLQGEFGEVLEQSIAFDPETRFSDATEFAEALEGIDPTAVECDATTSQTVTDHKTDAGDTNHRFGGIDVSESEQTDDTGETGHEPQPTRPLSDSLSVETINAAFGSTWPLKVLIALGVAIVATLTAAVLMFVDVDDETAPVDPPDGEVIADDDIIADGDDSDEPAIEPQPQTDDDPDDDTGDDEPLIVALQASPPDAEIQTADGVSLGTSPVQIELEEGEYREVIVDHPDYHPEDVTIDGNSRDIEIGLEQKQPEQDVDTVDTPDTEERRPAVDDSPTPADDTRAQPPSPSEPVEQQQEPTEEPSDWAMPGTDDSDIGDSDDNGDDEGYRLAP